MHIFGGCGPPPPPPGNRRAWVRVSSDTFRKGERKEYWNNGDRFRSGDKRWLDERVGDLFDELG